MGKEARIGLLLGAAACLLAVMVDWVVEELREEERSTAGQDRVAEPTPPAEKEGESAAEAPLTASS